ncbi:M23 family metallopeptidase [Conexibacter woesei]|uniref:Peptidase M23 n=1 Tax=Conexibacter woesei (strain DSM 14684 / CCUG 47730 / CIP 108061 / JCM 11494 / NBRC 100937 / ID131577) TaxID=469383 RepID=D3F1Z5_CONWI|nr:M23 family metallopeptidase [Conexibacter woesei]ADB50170.1 Peptidase M23 [Conexibacter woesei DSM 14684]
MSVVAWERRARALDGDIHLNGEEVDVVAGGGLVSFDEELSVSGSPIVRVGVLDPERVLVGSELLDLRRDDAEKLGREVELVVDGVAYWLRSVVKRRDVFELTFEDRTVCRLRDRGRPTKDKEGASDHRAFIRRLCALAKVEDPITRDPLQEELESRKSTGTGTSRGKRDRARRAADDRLESGIAPGARLRVKSAWGTPGQLDIASQLLEVATRLGASDKVMVSLIAVAIQESFLTNLRTPSEDGYGSYGVLQPRVDYSNTHLRRPVTMAQALDVAFNAEAFLRDPGWASKGGAMRWDRLRPDWTIGQLGQQVERGPPAADYDQWEGQARAIVEAYLGRGVAMQGGATSSGGRTETRLTVGRGESYWDAAVRIAESYRFRFFVVSNTPYYVADEALLDSRPRMTIAEDSPGVDAIDWEWAPRKELRQTEVECNVHAWQAPPGSVVELDDDCGPAAGRWLVGEYARSRFADKARITLVKGRKPTVPTEAADEGEGEGSAGASSAASRVGTSGYWYPLSARGKFLGGPGGDGSHSRVDWPHNWQSDEAVDIEVPVGTTVFAVRSGTVEKAAGSVGDGSGRTDGLTVTIKTDDGRRWFYTHLSTRSPRVRAGAKVVGGQQIGRSGLGGGVPHLHIAVDRGDPVQLLGLST